MVAAIGPKSEALVVSSKLLFALAGRSRVTAAARRIAILAGGGDVATGGQNQGGDGKGEENQRAAGHGLSPGILYLGGSRNGVVSNRREHLSRKVGFAAGP